jgi:hypothetical protein
MALHGTLFLLLKAGESNPQFARLLFTKSYYGDKIEKDELSRACNTGEMRNYTEFLSENSQGCGHL